MMKIKRGLTYFLLITALILCFGADNVFAGRNAGEDPKVTSPFFSAIYYYEAPSEIDLWLAVRYFDPTFLPEKELLFTEFALTPSQNLIVEDPAVVTSMDEEASEPKIVRSVINEHIDHSLAEVAAKEENPDLVQKRGILKEQEPALSESKSEIQDPGRTVVSSYHYDVDIQSEKDLTIGQTSGAGPAEEVLSEDDIVIEKPAQEEAVQERAVKNAEVENIAAPVEEIQDEIVLEDNLQEDASGSPPKSFSAPRFDLISSRSLIANESNDQVSNEGGPAVNMHKSLSIELILQYNRELRQMELVGQRILQRPPPKYRDPFIGAGQYLLELENGQGEVLGSFPLLNPSMMRAEWMKDTNALEPTLLEGKRLEVRESKFMIVVPFYEDLKRVNLLRPYPRSEEFIRGINLHRSPELAGEIMQKVGQCEINHQAIGTFIRSIQE